MRHVSLGPMIMGGAMGAMMLWMLHDRLMAGTGSLAGAGAAFVAGHVAAVLVLLAVALAFPGMRSAIRRHRPSPRHVVSMIIGMLIAAGLTHLAVHVGGVAWT